MTRLALLLFAASTAATAALAAHAAPPRPLSIDPTRSDIEAEVRASLHTFSARVQTYEARIEADPDDGRIHRATLRFLFDDLGTGDEKRDRHMREWEDTRQFPAVTFTLASLEPLADGKYTARGRLELHGTSREIAFPVSIAIADRTTYSIDGEVPLDTREHGLGVIRKFGVLKVNPVVLVRFHLQGTLASR